VLLELRVENYAVIDNVAVEFAPGLNLLTGETGAGKSILIDALALLLGDKASAEAVRHRIRHLIDAESAADVLSDDTIVERLRETGIDIARRTVAKYREAMRIPSSVQRRRDKQSMLGNALSAPAASSDRSRDPQPA